MVASIWQVSPNNFISASSLGLVNVKDSPYNAKGDGINDDYAAIQAALTFGAANNLAIYFPPGTYRLATAGLSLDGYSNFAIFGAGKYLSTIKRDAEVVGTCLNILNGSKIEISNLGFNGGFDLFPGGNANHGFVYNNCEHVIGRNLYATNYKNGGVNAFVSEGLNKYNIHFIECEVDGLGVANNGINIANGIDSSIQHCSAKGCPGSPGYGLQLKNLCQNSAILNSVVKACKAGVAFGNDTGLQGVTGCTVANILIDGCTNGIVTGYGVNNIFDNIKIDMKNIIGWGIDLDNNSSNNHFSNISGANVYSTRSFIRVRSGDYNTFDINSFKNPTLTSATLATIDSGVYYTKINIKHIVVPGYNPWDRAISDTSGNLTNIWYINYEPRIELHEIVSNTVTMNALGVRQLRLDTEGLAATDQLDTISAGIDNQLLYVQSSNLARDITVRDSSVSGGNIELVGGVSFTLNNINDSIVLMWKASTSRWAEVSRANT